MKDRHSNLWDFVDWLREAIYTKRSISDTFELMGFGWWEKGKKNVPIRINQNSLEIFIPLDSLWIPIFEPYYKIDLIEKIFLNGLYIIKEIYKKYDYARMIIENDKTTLKELDAKPWATSCFLKNGCKDVIQIWEVQRIETEVLSRVGKDNLIISHIETIYGAFILSEYIDDPYLNNFLPEKIFRKETESAFIPSSSMKVSYNINKDNDLTAMINKAYDLDEHLKCLSEHRNN